MHRPLGLKFTKIGTFRARLIMELPEKTLDFLQVSFVVPSPALLVLVPLSNVVESHVEMKFQKQTRVYRRGFGEIKICCDC